MFYLILAYFFPVVRDGGRYSVSRELLESNIKVYLIRNAVPALLFWTLEIYFMYSNLILAAILLAISLPFCLMFGMLMREYTDIQQRHHR